MRKRLVALGTALLAAAAIAPAGAAQQPGRTQTQQYVYSHGIDTWHWTVSAEEVLPALVFTPRPGDAWVHLAPEDASGQPVFVHVRQEAAGNGKDLREHFCDTAKILPLVSEEPVEVYVFSGACQNHTTGFATAGTVTATFARRR